MSTSRLLLTTSRSRLNLAASVKSYASNAHGPTLTIDRHRFSRTCGPILNSGGRNNDTSRRLLRSGSRANSSPDTDESKQEKKSESYQSYEYPWAKEPPEIRRTVVGKDGKCQTWTAIDPAQAPQPVTPPLTPPLTNPLTPPKTNAWSNFLGFFSQHNPDSNETSTAENAAASVLSTSPDSLTTVDPSSGTKSTAASAQQPSELLKQSILAHNDPFDDSQSLSEDERAMVLTKQKLQINSQLSSTVQPVQRTQPSYVPLPTPTSERTTPETIITELSNGVRVVSQETYGQVSTLGVVSELGSRYETPGVNTGVTNLLELLAFGACSDEYPSAASIAHTLQDWGASRFVSCGREQSIHCIDILRPNVDKAVHVLAQTLCQPEFPQQEVDEAKQAILFQSMPDIAAPEMYMQEALHRAAFGEDQQLGKPHFCPPSMLDKLTRQTCLDYWQAQFLANPKGLVVGGAGVDHDQLVRLVDDHFGHLQQQNEKRVPLTVSRYQGGYADFQIPPPTDFDPKVDVEDLSAKDKDKRLTRVAVALETGSWHDHHDVVVACVLQTLLGGGSAFSAGGPGKGMYSRLYREVLNVNTWAESAEAFTSFHSESGLIGIAGSAQPAKAKVLTQTLSEQLCRLATELVKDEELSRARIMLKCNVLTHLESRLILFEDISRQVLTYGHHEDMQATCRKIDAVTADDLKRIVVKALGNGPPTLVAVGVDISDVPQYNDVTRWLRTTAK